MVIANNTSVKVVTGLTVAAVALAQPSAAIRMPETKLNCDLKELKKLAGKKTGTKRAKEIRTHLKDLNKQFELCKKEKQDALVICEEFEKRSENGRKQFNAYSAQIAKWEEEKSEKFEQIQIALEVKEQAEKTLKQKKQTLKQTKQTLEKKKQTLEKKKQTLEKKKQTLEKKEKEEQTYQASWSRYFHLYCFCSKNKQEGLAKEVRDAKQKVNEAKEAIEEAEKAIEEAKNAVVEAEASLRLEKETAESDLDSVVAGQKALDELSREEKQKIKPMRDFVNKILDDKKLQNAYKTAMLFRAKRNKSLFDLANRQVQLLKQEVDDCEKKQAMKLLRKEEADQKQQNEDW